MKVQDIARIFHDEVEKHAAGEIRYAISSVVYAVSDLFQKEYGDKFQREEFLTFAIPTPLEDSLEDWEKELLSNQSPQPESKPVITTLSISGRTVVWSPSLSLVQNMTRSLNTVHSTHKFTWEEGRKFDKIWSVPSNNPLSKRSIHCFVGKKEWDGCVFKPASTFGPQRDATKQPDVRFQVNSITAFFDLIRASDPYGSYLYKQDARKIRAKKGNQS